MGASPSKQGDHDAHLGKTGRAQAITGAAGAKKGATLKLPANSRKTQPEDYEFIESAMRQVLVFQGVDPAVQRKIVSEMYERDVRAGDILIKEGDTGLAASQLYVVKSGEFEVLQKRKGVSVRVNMKKAGDCFGEISLIYSSPRTATVAATSDSTVFVLERDAFRYYVKEMGESHASQVELFLNSVPLLQQLSRDEKLRLVDAMEEKQVASGVRLINQGDPGDFFYIIKEGEAVVYQSSAQGTRKVNHLFKADFFGERALLSDEPRVASVEAITKLTCLCLGRDTFNEILGSLQQIMAREKSPQVVTQRLMKLQQKGTPTSIPAKVLIKRRKQSRNGQETWEVIRARGHAEEVAELRKSGLEGENSLELIEGQVLGGGAFSRVSIVKEQTTAREYALKRMRKSAVVQCPEHVFCEQMITKNTAHHFCIRQYASFQDKYHLYFLFDLMSGGDLMDVLVAEAKVVKHRVSDGALWRRGCLAPKQKMLKGMEEALARFYVACIVEALDYLHDNNIVYRDLKPENVFIDKEGFVKLGDFGFAKVLENGNRTYTFCGTPGYVAPENVLALGYNYSVDWWGLGVLMYVLLTGRQPFSSPKTEDPMVVMRRIVDDKWAIKFPPYVSAPAKDLILRLLERKPARRLGMLSGRANDIKKHPWFEGFDWEALDAHRIEPPRKPKNDSEKRLKELVESERKEGKPPQETPEEMQECEMVFADF